jgi:inosine-uridine nucleoside N-ribohydrolase/formylmethanofuran dehydrogenase subunit E
MKRFLIILISLTINVVVFSHPWKPAHYVIIDTDGGIDDMKAITMLLASPDIRVLAITASSGILNADTTYRKIRSLLNSFYHEGVPVGINRNCSFIPPEFPVALKTPWGKMSAYKKERAPDCMELIHDILSVEKTKISFICLGGLTTVNNSLTDIPYLRNQIKEIIWSSEGENYKNGFNYKIDTPAADNIIKGDIPLQIIKGLGKEVFYDTAMIKDLAEIPTIYAKKVSDFFKSEITKGHIYSYSCNDEIVPLFLHYPDLFQSDQKINEIKNPIVNIQTLRERTNKILSGETHTRNQVIKEFPSNPSFYSDDIEPFVADIINKYGMDEWISGVIANELHRHLGVFAIIGVKMGIRAREYFNTGVDEFKVNSFAGSVPPLSCMNDGLQVSTGATPGHGLLKVSNDSVCSPGGEFTYLNRKIRITLKPEIANKLSSELKEINFIYGLDSNIYWELVRKNSVKYWSNLDRHEIFIIEKIH